MKIGFIDYYLDEWHANHYPEWLKESSGGAMEVAYAYGEIASPHSGMTTEEWCRKYGVTPVDSIAELTALSDGIIVLSPDNSERHEELSRIPLRSGKPVYIDKTFAPDLQTACRIFAAAEESGTPCWSSSALRFAEEYRAVDRKSLTAANFRGPNAFDTYSIHQFEPLFMLMGVPAEQVMYLPGENYYLLLLRFSDGRVGSISGSSPDLPFTAQLTTAAASCDLTVTSDYFRGFIESLVSFFDTADIPVSHDETLRIMAAGTAAREAREKPFTWISVPALRETDRI